MRGLEQSEAKYRAKRKAHPRREIAIDLLVGLPIVAGVIWLFYAYFHAL